MLLDLALTSPRIAVAAMVAAGPNTTTSPGLKRVNTTTFVDQEATISIMGKKPIRSPQPLTMHTDPPSSSNVLELWDEEETRNGRR